VNVFGDAVGAAIVDHWEAKKFEELNVDDAFADTSSKELNSSGSIGIPPPSSPSPSAMTLITPPSHR
jgi:hypothetical protein